MSEFVHCVQILLVSSVATAEVLIDTSLRNETYFYQDQNENIEMSNTEERPD